MYKKWLLIHHPDKNKFSDPELVKDIIRCYNVALSHFDIFKKGKWKKINIPSFNVARTTTEYGPSPQTESEFTGIRQRPVNKRFPGIIPPHVEGPSKPFRRTREVRIPKVYSPYEWLHTKEGRAVVNNVKRRQQ